MLMLIMFLCGFVFSEILRCKEPRKLVLLIIGWLAAMLGSFMMYFHGIL